MREAGVFTFDTLDVSGVIKQQVNIRQIQRNHAIGTAPLAQQICQAISEMQRVNDFRVALGLSLRVRARLDKIAINHSLRFNVSESLAAADHRTGEPMRNRLAVRIESDEHTFAESVHAFLQTADAVRKTFWKHGNHQAWQIHTVAAFARALVECAAWFHPVRHVSDVHAKFPIAAHGIVLNTDGIVKVARIGRIDGEYQFLREIFAVFPRTSGFSVESARGFTGLVDRFFQKLSLEVEDINDGASFNVRAPSFTKHLGDHAFRVIKISGVADDLKDHFVASLRALGAGVTNHHRIAQ